MRRICAVLAALVALLVSAGYAAAEPSGGPADQALSQGLAQAAASSQAAGGLSGASQTQPSNGNISVRVLSPGDNGDVRQSNSTSSSSTAGNANATDQSAGQSGGCGCGGTQAIGQEASNDQASHALSLAGQSGASNGNVSVRVASPGDNGSVRQSNSVDSDAAAGNLNGTNQDADQSGGSGTQAIGQEAKNDQTAGAASLADQVGASNGNVSVRVLSPGDDGRTSQSNSVDSNAAAANLNGTKQDADQEAGGKGGCGCDGGVQAIGQEAKNDQAAGALSAAGQTGASNSTISVRVASPGDNGSVRQSNSVDSDAAAANLNGTKQDADQDGGSGVQAIDQAAKNDQTAIGHSGAFQTGASNSNTPVRVASPGHDGHVSQSNRVDSDATAANLNLTSQDADQDAGHSCGCHGSDGIQAIGQEARSDQGALAASVAEQRAGCGCMSGGNTNAPVRVDSRGGGGSVHQSNSVDSDATAVNANATRQDGDQDGGRGCGCGGHDIQAVGQSAKSRQTAIGKSAAIQLGASNVNTPVSVGGGGKGHDAKSCGCENSHSEKKGRGGSVSQSNHVDSSATAANRNGTHQRADQDGSGIQAIGQEAHNAQAALAFSLAAQLGSRNRA
jgi:hypothetical protein